MSFIKSILRLVLPESRAKQLTQRQQEIENYLSLSTDWYDLERREKELERKGYYR
jgi:hypothetical protein